MYECTCKLCGKKFQANHPNRHFCKGPHFFECPVCHKKFSVDKNRSYYVGKEGKACCCKSCTSKLVHMNKSPEQKQRDNDKRIQTMLTRYGVVNPGQMPEVLEKRKQTNLKKFGTEYANQSQAIKDKTRQTNIERYGVGCTFQAESVKKKARDTIRERYGVDHITQWSGFKDAVQRTSLERYGTLYPNQSEEVKQKIRQSCMDHYGVDNPRKSPEVIERMQQTKLKRYGTAGPNLEKLRRTTKERYGVDYYTQSEEYKEKVQHTSQQQYGVDHFLQSNEVKEKRRRTVINKYGTDNVRKSQWYKQHVREVFMERYGYEYPSQVPEIRHKQAKSARTSNLEKRVASLLESYDIPYTTQFVVSKGDVIHSFDFYVPDYKVLMDADGVYYHSYLSDPDGKFVGDYYDMVRLSLVPNDHVFVVAVEGHEDKAVKELHDAIKRMDSGAFDYDTELFQWCREVGFPYPSYTVERMTKDWNSLCKYESETYKPNARLGMSLIKNFHKSMYDARVGNCVSVREAWEDDNMLRKVIENRLIYKNNVDPSKVLQGFNISKTCPTVSVFNPVLAKYLTEKYLSDFDTVFDPFSGFSGRLLGVCSTGRKYVGQDLNARAVQESNEIIQLLNLAGASVSNKDVLKSSGTYPCLLTCPPYGRKETYAQEITFKSCDEWIDECLSRFKCKRYVFVVDKTEKYRDCVAETITNKSHLYKTCEYVVVVDR